MVSSLALIPLTADTSVYPADLKLPEYCSTAVLDVLLRQEAPQFSDLVGRKGAKRVFPLAEHVL
jgi:hypothetical protein